MSNKGQTFTTDFMASIVIFGFIITIFLTMWNLGLGTQEELTNEEIMDQQATRTMAIMTTTQGYPENWPSNIGTREDYIPGFMGENHNLEQQRIEDYGNKDYEDKRDILRVPEFQITFENEEAENLEMGREPEDASYIIVKEREVTIKDEDDVQTPTKMRYIVWG